MECPSCAVEINKNSEVCPICGYEFARRKAWPRWIAVLLLMLAFYAAVRIITAYF
jgi:RNA polymerase subunit RPABC4/transcription elongation factor Spt4